MGSEWLNLSFHVENINSGVRLHEDLRSHVIMVYLLVCELCSQSYLRNHPPQSTFLNKMLEFECICICICVYMGY